jgi:hypothetical protein
VEDLIPKLIQDGAADFEESLAAETLNQLLAFRIAEQGIDGREPPKQGFVHRSPHAGAILAQNKK